MYKFKSELPKLMIDSDCDNLDDYMFQIQNNTFTSLDEEVPVCRFRGTVIKSNDDGYDVLGWERNVSRLQKMDVSLVAIITLKLSKQFVIKEIVLDKGFAGSKGLLCSATYLNGVLNEKLIGKQLDSSLIKELAVEKLYCFHLSEILCAVISDLELLVENNLNELYEEEVLDGYKNGMDLVFRGKQVFSFTDYSFDYSIVLNEAAESIKFAENGGLYFDRDTKATFYSEGEEVFSSVLNGSDKMKAYVRIGAFSNKALDVLKKKITNNRKNMFMCSILSPQGFIGCFIQSLSMKMYSNNYNYVLHCLTGLQRFSDKPRCIGAVKDCAEAEVFFPDFNIMEALAGQ